MPRISEMPPPDFPLTGLELTPVLQGAGVPGNRGVPLLAYGNLPRGNVLGLRVPMAADMSATTEADPGAGMVRWNNADPHLATELYVSDDADAGDLAALFGTLNVGGFVYLQGGPVADRGNLQSWQVTSISAETGYTKLGVTTQQSAGTFTDADDLELTIQQPTPSPGVDRNLVNDLGTSGAVGIDCALGDYFRLALSGNATLSAPTNVPPACSIMVRIVQDSTARTLAWPAAFKWAGGTPPAISTDAGAVDLLAASTFDAGASWQATLAKAFA